MKRKILLSFSLILFVVCVASPCVYAQGVKNGPDASVVRDPALEKESMHNLEVARHYFRLKKAYRAAIARCEEMIAGYPNFSKIDEVLYIAGKSSLLLSQNRGKQAPNIPADKLREDAREYLSRIVNDFPQSEFRERAESDLKELGGPKTSSQKSGVRSQNR